VAALDSRALCGQEEAGEGDGHGGGRHGGDGGTLTDMGHADGPRCTQAPDTQIRVI
jgi:hypothetical protein